MKKTTLFFALLLLHSMYSFSQDLGTKTLEEIRQKQIENIKNPELWDMERMKDLDIEPIKEREPIRFGAFPVPHYNSLFGFDYRGGGTVDNKMARSLPDYRITVEDKEIVFASFQIGNSELYKEEQRNTAFFTVLTVIDTVDTDNFALGASRFISRNHPDYTGQGSFITKDNKVEFVAFATPDKGNFAIVNMRLFHLEYGNIILITPQKDGSFRSLQIQGSVPPAEASFEYIKTNVLQREEVIKFFTAKGVI
ncbi:hypothetical protein V8G56_08680 [Gaetbulibacter aquiaggeris]|uniref:Uncharacterized protein n=1 Tax=Gaetbulibacter aquiaggeris TaxID=1735373 RepID=A0ABW7MSN0_9FLAO